ncbi:MAG: hypothetical protein M3R16_06740 [Pseudomonadota bacterium]|nr:hypothetical protein [Pseudomonadota bacterium]
MKSMLLIFFLFTASCSMQMPDTSTAGAPVGASHANDSIFDAAASYGSPDDYASLRGEYLAAKSLVAKVVEEDVARSKTECERDPECKEEMAASSVSEDEPFFAVFDCGFTPGVDQVGEETIRESTYSLLKLAKGVHFLEEAAADFPAYVWRPSLARYVEESLTTIQRQRFLESTEQDCCQSTNSVDYPYNLVVDLRRYRDLENSSLAPLVAEEGCGAGEFSVRFDTEPVASDIRIIPEFFARLCVLRKQALEGDACPYWMNIASGQELAMSGMYRYEITWPGRETKRGVANMDAVSDPRDEDDVATYLVRRGH